MGWCSNLHLGLETAIGVGLIVAVADGFGLRAARGNCLMVELFAGLDYAVRAKFQIRVGIGVKSKCAIFRRPGLEIGSGAA